MTIVQISDTHNCHRQLANLPTADVLVHCGDFTDMGTEQEVLDFLNWLIELPYKHKVFVTGNHDLCLWEAADIEGLICHALEHSILQLAKRSNGVILQKKRKPNLKRTTNDTKREHNQY